MHLPERVQSGVLSSLSLLRWADVEVALQDSGLGERGDRWGDLLRVTLFDFVNYLKQGEVKGDNSESPSPTQKYKQKYTFSRNSCSLVVLLLCKCTLSACSRSGAKGGNKGVGW